MTQVWKNAQLDTGDIDQVIASELALLSPQVRRSPAQVDELLDPDFREIGISGRMWTRPEMVSALAEESSDDDEQVVATELNAAVVGPGLILVTYTTDRRESRARRSSLWRRSRSAWRLLHQQRDASHSRVIAVLRKRIRDRTKRIPIAATRGRPSRRPADLRDAKPA